MSLETRFGGLRAFFSGEGGFLVEVSGHGDLFFSSFGGVVEQDVAGELVVDTGHVVAWEPSLSYTIGGVGGIKQTLFSGEGLVMRFSGHGRIYLQTRQLPALAGWLTPYLALNGFRGWSSGHDVPPRDRQEEPLMEIEILGQGAFESALVHLRPVSDLSRNRGRCIAPPPTWT